MDVGTLEPTTSFGVNPFGVRVVRHGVYRVIISIKQFGILCEMTGSKRGPVMPRSRAVFSKLPRGPAQIVCCQNHILGEKLLMILRGERRIYETCELVLSKSAVWPGWQFYGLYRCSGLAAQMAFSTDDSGVYSTKSDA